MHSNNFQKPINICMKKYENSNNASKPYRALNMVVRKAEEPIENEPINQEEITSEDKTINQDEVGYISVRVYTALGALPVPGAVVTIYSKAENGEENAINQLVTDANGNIAHIELPVLLDSIDPSFKSKYYYSTYNMRIQALGYYTVNVLDLRIFPGISTDYKIDLIPAIVESPRKIPEQTIIIPPPPIESTIE